MDRKPSTLKEETEKPSFSDRLNFVIQTKVKKTRHPKILQSGRTRDIYPMSSPKRGFCVIIANFKFSYLPPLKGYSGDCDYLEEIFKQLHFEVKVFRNLTGGKIKEQFRRYGKSQPVSESSHLPIQPDAFVGIILSHGNGDFLYGATHNPNGTKDATTVEELKTILNNRNCPGLKDKPKILFVQACRGENEDQGVPNQTTRNKSMVVGEDENSQCSMDEMFNLIATPSLSKDVSSKTVAKNEETNTTLILESDNSPTMTDILVCYSTLNGYVSYVYDNGSVFGVALAENLILHAHNMDLRRILSKVSKAVSEEEIPTSKTRAQHKKQKQVVNVHDTGWHNQLFFNPGHPKITKEAKIQNQDDHTSVTSPTPDFRPTKNEADMDLNASDLNIRHNLKEFKPTTTSSLTDRDKKVNDLKDDELIESKRYRSGSIKDKFSRRPASMPKIERHKSPSLRLKDGHSPGSNNPQLPDDGEAVHPTTSTSLQKTSRESRGPGRQKCSKCKESGHNVRTCRNIVPYI